VVMKFLGPRETSAEKLQITSVTFYGFQRKSLLDVSLFADVNCTTVKNNQLHNINWSVTKCRKRLQCLLWKYFTVNCLPECWL